MLLKLIKDFFGCWEEVHSAIEHDCRKLARNELKFGLNCGETLSTRVASASLAQVNVDASVDAGQATLRSRTCSTI